MPKQYSVLLLSLLFAAGSASSGTITIETSLPDENEVFGVSDSISSSAIEGLTANVEFADGTTESVLWSSTGADSGGASGTGWSLTSTGEALSHAMFSNSSGQNIVFFSLTGPSPNVAFDVGDTYGSGRTAGTGAGSAFMLLDASEDLDLFVLYSDAVSLSGNVFGDLFRGLSVNIVSGGISSGEFLSFSTDVDFVDIDGSAAPVPAPAPLVMLGLALAICGTGSKGRRARA